MESDREELPRRNWVFAILVRAALAAGFWWFVVAARPLWVRAMFLIFALLSTVFLVMLVWAARRSLRDDA